jgi:sugar lactone lactonase YvrE
VTTIHDVGFNQPENLVYDSAADVFLDSTMGGGGTAHDDNGFISRLGPDGRVLQLRWIAGGRNGATLDAPKGLAIRGDTLAVADLGAVRLFDRRTGAPIRAIEIPGLVMNDVAFASDGSIWITDTGPARTPAPVDTTHDMDAVWMVSPTGDVHAVSRGLALGRPDGLVLEGNAALVATFGANRIERVSAASDHERATVRVMPGGRLDGLRRLADGTLLVSSWDAKTVWSLAPGRAPRALLTGVVSPAGIAVDTRRHRVAVTSMQGNGLYFVPLG